jgi:transcriptional regulatory protein LevR
MKASDMYEVAKEEAKRINRGKGILLLVDMGSLVNFGEMITEETGIIVKTIDMVSTPTVIAACRKAVIGSDLFDIYHSCIDDRRVSQIQDRGQTNNEKQRLIITACFTGEGASEKLKKIIKADVSGEDIEVRPLNVISKNEFTNAVHVLSEDYVVLAIISTIPIQIEGYRFISAMDYLSGKSKGLLQELIKQDASMRNVAQSLKEHINKWDSEDLVLQSQKLLQQLVKANACELPEEVFTGMLLHLCFLVERKLSDENVIKFEGLETFENQYAEDFVTFRKNIRPFEVHFGIGIESDEVAHLVRMFKENINEISNATVQ